MLVTTYVTEICQVENAFLKTNRYKVCTDKWYRVYYTLTDKLKSQKPLIYIMYYRITPIC